MQQFTYGDYTVAEGVEALEEQRERREYMPRGYSIRRGRGDRRSDPAPLHGPCRREAHDRPHRQAAVRPAPARSARWRASGSPTTRCRRTRPTDRPLPADARPQRPAQPRHIREQQDEAQAPRKRRPRPLGEAEAPVIVRAYSCNRDASAQSRSAVCALLRLGNRGCRARG